MQLTEVHKHVGDVIAAGGAALTWIGAFSELVTIAVGIATFTWFSLRVFQLLTPKRYQAMQSRLDLKEKSNETSNTDPHGNI